MAQETNVPNPAPDRHDQRPLIGLRDAADLLGVHYMTAYRYVRLGALPATKVGGEWRVRLEDVEQYGQHEEGSSAPGAGGVRWPKYRDQLMRRLLQGDEPGAWAVVERALGSGADAQSVLVELLTPVLARVGDDWKSGALSVADEHRAAAVATRLVGRLGPSFARRGRRRGVVVVGAAPGDHHALPTSILRDVLRGDGFEVMDLGGDTPIESFVATAVSRDDVVAIAISVGWDGALDAAGDTAARLHARVPDTPIFIGGPAVKDATHARALGADEFGLTALDVVVRCGELADTARGSARRTSAPGT